MLGFRIESSDWEVERVDPKTLTPQQFFEAFVKKRKPAVLTGIDDDPNFRFQCRMHISAGGQKAKKTTKNNSENLLR